MFALSHLQMLNLKVSFRSRGLFNDKPGRKEIEDWSARQPHRPQRICDPLLQQCGLLATPYRIGGQRRYSSHTVYRVLLIRFASDMGFTLDEIKLFLSGLRVEPPRPEGRGFLD